jgi:putative heme-binding domain-containing protein
MRLLPLATVLALTAALLATIGPHHATADEPQAAGAAGPPARVPWTTSRVTGSPEPPHPFVVERAFPNLQFKNPLLLARTGDRFFVGEHAGKIFSFRDDQQVARADLFFDLTTELSSWDKSKVKGVDALYGLAFHPNFAQNRYCYVCYVLNSVKDGEQLPDGSRVSRFTVTDTDPPRVDPKSEKVLITWLAGGHNGGDLHFGPDGMLYISTGDGTNPNPPDLFLTGQDISDLLSSILRIDVDHQDPGKAYAVPADNPFVKTPNARPEVWAYGFRNPWRMSFDRGSGDLWVGDVGWELWEMVYRVKKGGNYGWSIMEGRQPVRPEGQRGPTPILPPNLDFPHTEAASITGGYVYRGKRLKDLIGAYVCGDWVTRKLWATKFDGDRIVWHKEIAQGTQRIVAFGEDRDGELYFLDYDEAGKIYRLAPNPAATQKPVDFPRRLSETGLFTSAPEGVPAPGVLPFRINAEQWADQATAERFLGLPGTSVAKMYDSPIPIPGGFFSGAVFFPKDGVLAKTIALETERGNPKSRRLVETQLLHFDGTTWRAYSYAWNEEQTDAVLVPAAGQDRVVTVTDAQAPGGKRRQMWHYPSRAECITCHNPWAGYTLAFTLPQLHQREQDKSGGPADPVRVLQQAGFVELLHNPSARGRFVMPRPLTDPHGPGDLNERARSYLHTNCGHCHRFGGGGTADLELCYGPALEQTKTLEVRPTQGAFGIPNAHILSPGDPYRSVLYYRMAKLGRGRMPHIGSTVVDEAGLRLIRDWIQSLPGHKDERLLVQQLRNSRLPAAERKAAVDRLLASTSSALLLAEALGAGRLPAAARTEVLAAAAKADAQIYDLFERFVPEDQRVQRLGSVIRPEQILSLKGNAERGRVLFFQSAGLQCVNCHRVNGTGAQVGPDLSQIARQQTRAQLLESLLEPSKQIDPKYVAYLVETTDGRLFTGLLGSKDDKEVVLKVVGDKEVRIPAAKVERLAPQSKSLMPDLLLRDLTAEQAADLLEFLASLK